MKNEKWKMNNLFDYNSWIRGIKKWKMNKIFVLISRITLFIVIAISLICCAHKNKTNSDSLEPLISFKNDSIEYMVYEHSTKVDIDNKKQKIYFAKNGLSNIPGKCGKKFLQIALYKHITKFNFLNLTVSTLSRNIKN